MARANDVPDPFISEAEGSQVRIGDLFALAFMHAAVTARLPQTHEEADAIATCAYAMADSMLRTRIDR